MRVSFLNFYLHLVHKNIFIFQEEISEIIESVPPSPLNTIEDLECLPSSAITPFQSSPKPMTRDRSYGTNSLLSNTNLRRQATFQKPSGTPGKDDISDWSENILAEFNNIIAKEINELTCAKLNAARRNFPVEEERVEYKDLLNEFGICDSDSSNNSLEDLPNGIDSFRSDRKPVRVKRNQINQNSIQDEEASAAYTNTYSKDRLVIQKRRLSGSLPENLQSVEGRDRMCRKILLNSNWVESNQSLPMDPKENLLRLKRNSSSLPTDFDLKDVTKFPGGNYEPKKEKNCDKISIEREASGTSNRGPWSGFKLRNLENLKAKLPPRQVQESRRKTSLSNKQNKRRKINYERIQRTREHDSDYEDNRHESACRSKSLENYVPRSAPVTPTEEKKMPFSRLLKKKHTPVFHENGNGAILVRVSSLPDQDLLHLSNEQLSNTGKKGRSKDGLMRKRDLSPSTLRSNLTAKRLSESNKDVGRVSPVSLKKFPFRRTKSNDVAVECHFPNMERGENLEVGMMKNGTMEDECEKRFNNEDSSKAGSVSL